MNVLVGSAWSAKCHLNVSMDIANHPNILMSVRKKQPRPACIAMLLLRRKPGITKMRFWIPQVTSQSRSLSGLLHPYVNTVYSNKITEQSANDEEHIHNPRSDPFEEVFDSVIDPNFFYTERPSFKFGNQTPRGTIVKGNDNFMTFISDAEYATWSERPSSVSEEREIGTSYQGLEDGFGAKLAKLHMYARDERYSGFSISSGWSSTFFPHGMEEDPHTYWIWHLQEASNEKFSILSQYGQNGLVAKAECILCAWLARICLCFPGVILCFCCSTSYAVDVSHYNFRNIYYKQP